MSHRLLRVQKSCSSGACGCWDMIVWCAAGVGGLEGGLAGPGGLGRGGGLEGVVELPTPWQGPGWHKTCEAKHPTKQELGAVRAVCGKRAAAPRPRPALAAERADGRHPSRWMHAHVGWRAHLHVRNRVEVVHGAPPVARAFITCGYVGGARRFQPDAPKVVVIALGTEVQDVTVGLQAQEHAGGMSGAEFRKMSS